MATIGSNALTLAEHAKRVDDNGAIASIVELLSQQNPVLDDMPVIECNMVSGHKTTVRRGLPAGTWRKLNYGVPPSKSQTATVTDTCGMLEDYSKVDKALADLGGNPIAFRKSEDDAFMEGMGQTIATTFFYGDTDAYPERFLGLDPRFDDVSADNGANILDGGGENSDNTSIWLIGWGEQSVHGIIPKGSTAGLQVRDLGEDTVQDENGNEYQAYRTHFKHDIGLTVRDWRYIVRIANIDVTTLLADPEGSGTADLFDLLAQSLETIQSLENVKPMFYGNRTISSFLRRQRAKAKNVNISMEEAAGRRIMHVDEVPFRRTDALLNTESAISFS